MCFRRLSVLSAILLVSGCASLPNPLGSFTPDFTSLPEDELRRVAENIERSVRQGNPDALVEGSDRVSLNSPLIIQAIRTRTLLEERLSELLRAGYAYELRNGLVKLHATKAYNQATTRQERDRNANIIYSEVQNRWTLYEGLVKLNGWPNRSLDAVRGIFFEARLGALRPGEHFESESGDIAIKAE